MSTSPGVSSVPSPDIAYHGAGVLAYCAWNERRQLRVFRGKSFTFTDADVFWLNGNGEVKRLSGAELRSRCITVSATT